jgi:hypothetical protein
LAARLKFLIAIGSAALLTACSMDKTNNPGLSEYVNHCFVTLQDAIYLSRECNAYNYCDTVQSLNKFVTKLGYPETLRQFRDDPGGWSARIRQGEDALEPPLKPGHTVVYGAIPAGTPLTVVQIMSRFEGENGRYYRTYAIFDSGEFKGRRIVLPRTNTGVIIDMYLARCEKTPDGK